METQPFVGCHEIEQMHGIPKHRVTRFMKRGLWPDPIAPLKCGLVFRTTQVAHAVDRLRTTGKL
jgi:hypothetical protein